jgi:hypothetical protein
MHRVRVRCTARLPFLGIDWVGGWHNCVPGDTKSWRGFTLFPRVRSQWSLATVEAVMVLLNCIATCKRRRWIRHRNERSVQARLR